MTDVNRSPNEHDVRAGAWVRVKRGIKCDKRAPVVKVLDGDILVLIDGKKTRVHRTDVELVPVRAT